MVKNNQPSRMMTCNNGRVGYPNPLLPRCWGLATHQSPTMAHNQRVQRWLCPMLVPSRCGITHGGQVLTWSNPLPWDWVAGLNVNPLGGESLQPPHSTNQPQQGTPSDSVAGIIQPTHWVKVQYKSTGSVLHQSPPTPQLHTLTTYKVALGTSVPLCWLQVYGLRTHTQTATALRGAPHAMLMRLAQWEVYDNIQLTPTWGCPTRSHHPGWADIDWREGGIPETAKLPTPAAKDGEALDGLWSIKHQTQRFHN